MKLTDRLQMIADMVQNQEGIIADVGTDHGWIPIYLAKKFKNRKIYAMDVRKEPLQRARGNARDHGLEEKIQFHLSDGLKACLTEEISTLIIAGMGGILMDRLLDEGKSCFGVHTELILSPHKNPDLVRKRLHRLGFRIEYERYMKEMGQIYVLIYAVRGVDLPYTQAEYIFGKTSKTRDLSVLREYRTKELEEMESVLEHLQSLVQTPGIQEKITTLNVKTEFLKALIEQETTEKGETNDDILS